MLKSKKIILLILAFFAVGFFVLIESEHDLRVRSADSDFDVIELSSNPSQNKVLYDSKNNRKFISMTYYPNRPERVTQGCSVDESLNNPSAYVPKALPFLAETIRIKNECNPNVSYVDANRINQTGNCNNRYLDGGWQVPDGSAHTLFADGGYYGGWNSPLAAGATLGSNWAESENIRGSANATTTFDNYIAKEEPILGIKGFTNLNYFDGIWKYPVNGVTPLQYKYPADPGLTPTACTIGDTTRKIQAITGGETFIVRNDFYLTEGQAAKVSSFYLEALTDDWSIVYVNGNRISQKTEVSSNVPARYGNPDGQLSVDDIIIPTDYLKSGNNVIAVQVTNKPKWGTSVEDANLKNGIGLYYKAQIKISRDNENEDDPQEETSSKSLSCSVTPQTGLSPLVINVTTTATGLNNDLFDYRFVKEGGSEETVASRGTLVYYTLQSAGNYNIFVRNSDFNSNSWVSCNPATLTVNDPTDGGGGEVVP